MREFICDTNWDNMLEIESDKLFEFSVVVFASNVFLDQLCTNEVSAAVDKTCLGIFL